MDAQHKRLVELINQLHDAMISGDGTAKFAPTVDALLEYARQHFADEEALQEQYGYSGLAEHKRSHEKLTQQVKELRQRLLSGEPISSFKVLEFLRRWLFDHILGEDMVFGVEVTGKRLPSAKV